MKHLKKLTRKGLEELAKEMPQVNEVEQSECIGAYRIYLTDSDCSKESSTKIGVSEDIKIMTPALYSNFMGLYYDSDPSVIDGIIDNYCVAPDTLCTNPSAGGFNMALQIFYTQVLENVETHGLCSGFTVAYGNFYASFLSGAAIGVVLPSGLGTIYDFTQTNIDNDVQKLNDMFDELLYGN